MKGSRTDFYAGNYFTRLRARLKRRPDRLRIRGLSRTKSVPHRAAGVGKLRRDPGVNLHPKNVKRGRNWMSGSMTEKVENLLRRHPKLVDAAIKVGDTWWDKLGGREIVSHPFKMVRRGQLRRGSFYEAL